MEQEITGICEKFRDDPAAFVAQSFSWGRGQLAGAAGPDWWQQEILSQLGQASKKEQALRVAVASGHGVGKTALMAWVILWFLCTRPHPQVVVTANTRPQLATKTWRELSKWHKLSSVKPHFAWTATKFYLKAHPETWFAAAIPWVREKPEAFAGTHERHVCILYDEASIIPDEIWDVTEGAMTTPGALWLAFGNPTRNTGRFRECFGRFRHRWETRQVDSRKSALADKTQISQWIADFGEDSDFVRIRVRGEFPRASATQFVPLDFIEQARGRTVHPSIIAHAPVVLGVDVARFGDDQSVICVRQGLAVVEIVRFRDMSTVDLARMVAFHEDRHKADAVLIDAVGIGAGVVDYLKSINRSPIEVNAGSRACQEERYINLRAEMWAKVREWLQAGGCLPDDDQLCADLAGPEYSFDARQRFALEKKSDMKARGLASPDSADALALTFAAQVEKKTGKFDTAGFEKGQGERAITEYNLFE